MIIGIKSTTLHQDKVSHCARHVGNIKKLGAVSIHEYIKN